MNLVFHYRQPFTKQLALLEAVIAGAKTCGDEVVGEEGFERVRDVDGLVMFGIGGHSRPVFDAYRQAGKRIVFWDKGYIRGSGKGTWFRVAVDDFQPLAYLGRINRPADRLDALNLIFKPYHEKRGQYILFDGTSNKFCVWHGLGDLRAWGRSMVEKIAKHTSMPIVYRPRPSHNGMPEPVSRLARHSMGGPLDEEMANAHVVVSYGGNIGWDAVIGGVPHFAIGDSIARPVSEIDWPHVGVRFKPSDEVRRQWAANVAHCQWLLPEIENGQAWRVIKEQMGPRMVFERMVVE
jgi:hypothetical protein